LREVLAAELLGQRLELVADPVAGVDERVARSAPVDLLPELPHEDVHRPVAMGRAPAPDTLQELVPREHPALLAGKGVDQTELRRRQLGARSVDVGLDVVRVEPELLDLDRVTPARRGLAHPAPGGCPDARGELLERERL